MFSSAPSFAVKASGLVRNVAMMALAALYVPHVEADVSVLPTPSLIIATGPVNPAPRRIAVTLAMPDEPSMSVPDEEVMAIIAGPGVEIAEVTAGSYVAEPESYTLRLDSCHAVVNASDYRGAVYALQTLARLAAADSLPRTVTVSDAPRCRWRAFMLDSGRQFQSVATIKKYLRMASMLKLNRFHWHLTEGLGWRVEIDALPRLAEVGGYVASGPEQQGFYSKEEIRDIVAYAAGLGIEIVPEIDIPGHSEAALSAYPALGCRGVAPKVPETGFTSDIFCAGNDSTVAALKLILDEVCEMFQGQYIHLGGDEVPKDNWDTCPRCQARISAEGLADSHDLQLWLSAEMARHIAAKGRKAIFWDDVLHGDATVALPSNAVVQWWNYRGRGRRAVDSAIERGIPLILSPNYYCYLNFPAEPWRGYGPERTFGFEKAYLRNPADSVMAAGEGDMLGITAALWTDYGLTEDMLDDRLFPRIFALAELMWHGGARRPLAELRDEAEAASRYFRRREAMLNNF